MDTTTTYRLRTLLRLDSAVCLVSGASTAAAAGPLADALGLDGSAAVRAVGVFLLAYGVVLAGLARADRSTVHLAGRLTALADASWVVATVALVGAGAFSSGGNALVALAAIPVGALGIGKAAALRS